MYRFTLCFLILIFSVQPLWADTNNDGLHVLKGRIIRSLAVDAKDPAHILVGQKAKTPGSALVFQSKDGGKTWRTLNGNKSLHPMATDVQAIIAVSKQTFLAGTWKQGLYISEDAGNSFKRVQGIPSSDIRDLQITGASIYAATARDGVFESTDGGHNWAALGPGKDFIWSLTLADNHVFASSPENGVFERPQSGGKWHTIFDEDGANAIAITPGSGRLRAVAGTKGLYLSAPSGWRKSLAGENFADVTITSNNHVLAGSWDNGVAILTSGGKIKKRWLKGRSVVHIQIANQQLLAGTWGDGLYIIPVAQLLSPSQFNPPLIAAVLTNNPAQVKQLLEAGVAVDQPDQSHNTALTFAARDGQTKIVKMLLVAGADPGWIDAEGVTPLILAVFKGHPEIAKLLLSPKLNARRDHADKWGRTAKDYAKRRGADDAIYKLLVE